MILPNGTLLQGGKYRIEEKIGQGGFGITYRACQPLMLDRKVCIKEFYLKQCFSRESTSSAITYPNDSARKDAEVFQQKFIKEAQTLYSMHHPNIMEIYDIFEENNTAYYVMEYIEGESLKDMLERRGSIPEAEAIGYIRKVAEALKYIHSRNFNHFDVKPDNILVRSSDKEVILIDFGTAKHYDSNTGNATTMTAGLLSRGYAPIEQYKEGGVSSFTPETDIYALGATLYKLLTGNTPPEPTEIISNGIPELPSSVSQATKDLIKWAMQLNKADRPHSCDEFMNALPSNVEGNVTGHKDETDDVTVSIESEETTYVKKPSENNEETELVKSVKAPKADVKEDRKQTEDVLKYAEVGVIDNRKQKVLMSVTGIALILFLTFHMSMNLVILFSEEDYNMICEMLSANRYAVVATMVLAVLAVLHILYAFGLAMQNRKARGEERYAVTDKPMKVEWASQNMLVLGLIIFFGLVLHLYDFWYKMMFQELVGGDVTYATDGGYWIRESFSNPIHVVLYLIWFTAIWFYLTHGFWNALHTLGLNGKKWFGRWQWIGIIYVTALMGGFALVAVGYCLQCYK